MLPKSPVTIERSLAVIALEDGYVSRGNDMLMMHSLPAPEMTGRTSCTQTQSHERGAGLNAAGELAGL